MIIQINKKNFPTAFLLFTLCISFFFPSLKVTSLISIIRYISLMAGLAVLVMKNQSKPNKNTRFLFGLLPLMYYVYMYVISWHNEIEYANTKTLSAIFQFLIIISLFIHLWKRNRQLAYNVLFTVFLILVVWDIVDIFRNPNGGLGTNQWLFGNKNNHSLYFYLLIYTLFLKCKANNRFGNRVFLVIFMILTTFATILMGSSTSISSIFVVDIAIILFLFYKGRFHIKSFYILIGAWVLNIVLIIGQTGFLSNIVSLFGKDLTFSERTIAWSSSLVLIAQKPIFGWGMIHGSYAKQMIGYANAHNQLLDCVVSGGVILLVFFIFLLLYLAKNINQVHDSEAKLFNEIFFAALLLKMIFEQIAADYLFWVLIIIMLCDMSLYHNVKEQT